MKTLLKTLGWLIALGALAALIGHRAYLRYEDKRAQSAVQEAGEGPEDAIRVMVQKVERRDLRRSALLTGTVRPMAQVLVMSKVSGRLDELRLADGTPVEEGLVIAKKGVRIAVIDHEAFAAQVRQAEAALAALEAEQQKMEAGARPQELEIARANVRGAEAAVQAAESATAQAQATLKNATSDVERTRNLHKDNVVTKQRLDNAEAQYSVAKERYGAARDQARAAGEKLKASRQQLALTEEGARKEDRAALAARVRQAKAAVELAGISLAESTIEAPIAGVVSRKNLDEGNMVSPGVCIVTLVQMDTVKVVVGAGEREIALIREGATKATVRVDAYPEQAFVGTVKRVSPVADEQTRTIELEVHVPNPGRRLKPGMFARVELVLEEKKGVPTIPDHAVLRDDDKTHVYVANGGTARRRSVRLGLAEGAVVEVVEGLKVGEMVVTSGQRRLEDGVAVVVEEEGAPR